MSAILPLIAVALNYRNLDNVLKIAAVFFLIAAVFELTLVMAMRIGFSNNMPLLHLFVAINIVFFSAIYYKAFDTSLFRKTVFFTGSGALILVASNALFIQGILTYPSLANTVQSIILIIFSLLYFYQIFAKQEYVHIEKQALFWINSGVLIYFSINIFLFMLFNRIIEQQIEGFYAIHSVTNIFSNVLYTIGLFCKPQKTA